MHQSSVEFGELYPGARTLGDHTTEPGGLIMQLFYCSVNPVAFALVTFLMFC